MTNKYDKTIAYINEQGKLIIGSFFVFYKDGKLIDADYDDDSCYESDQDELIDKGPRAENISPSLVITDINNNDVLEKFFETINDLNLISVYLVTNSGINSSTLKYLKYYVCKSKTIKHLSVLIGFNTHGDMFYDLILNLEKIEDINRLIDC